ncbi:MAG: lipoyl(octanoyl) transferase [Bacteroidetes bacterium GWE2_41_25]|nr:MAG: lipoyl(octanoyl) transferase [Bacteroidetes bacterium GWA2_40_15]OFX95822.1 MAG: lipoyl(octanoyl) transferase [Bacteroidetes bacterium GWE2_41_25]OFY60286.1 MAG: lipoyl(octanoyl) transferase [Bacteroidetes bacterium GWF2_41_9]HAM10168.1 lipoate--protein ligase [Bacteroidales bacterium]HBQ82255.1 lipoate--protein ligase [Bacteroidales bacterium]
MKYKVEYKDLGIRDYKEIWDYQTEIFDKLVCSKKADNTGIVPGGERLPGVLIFVEHPHVYTLGKSGSEDNLMLDYIQLKAKDASFYRIDRGGDITYHGPGQIVGYPIFDLDAINVGLKEYIYRIEEAIIRTIAESGLTASRFEGGTGVWLDPGIAGKARKICAIGVRASRYVTMHGFAFNVNTNLEYFNYINPCGFTDKGVTSLEKELGVKQNFESVKDRVKKYLEDIFDLEIINQ